MIDLPPERPGLPAPPDLAALRAQMDAAIAAGFFATSRLSDETSLGGLRALRFLPDGTPRGHMLQLHGGGYRIGKPEFDARFAEALASHCGIAVHVPQYRLAPEAPFPAGLNDALAALRALADLADGLPLFIGGDSAGGGLAASLGVLAAQSHAPPITGLVLLSPWLDLTVTDPAYVENAASDPLFSRESATVAAQIYLQGSDPRHPLASPLFADLAGFPPVLVSVGTGEVLHGDALRFHQRLLAAGGDSTLSVIAGMDHVAVVRGADLPGAAETFAAIVRFFNDSLAGMA